MPAIAAAPLFYAALAGGAATVGGAAIASHSAGKAAKTQSDAATRAAEIQAQSEREALAFKQQQARQDQLNAETAQHANYDQWRAREGRMSGLGSLLGLPAREIPAYVPIPTAPSASTATPAQQTAATLPTNNALVTMQAPNGQIKQVPSAQAAYYASRGATFMR